MEDPRLSRMYAALWRRKLAERWHSARQTAVKRSGLLVTIVVAALLLVVAVGLKERGRGNLTKLKTELGVPKPVSPEALAIRPGGQDPIVLERGQTADMDTPEFLSATLLPGRGMNLLQIKAYVPQKGTVDLLASPSLKEAAAQMTGEGEDADGRASLSMGGAFEAPWAGRIWGSSSNGSDAVDWMGHSLHLPMDHGVSNGGLLLMRKADTVKTNVMPDGGQVQVTYDAGDFDGHWISDTHITTTVQLNSRVMEMSISAHNTGSEAEPIGLGWQPKFAIPSEDRSHVLLKLPNALRVEVANGHGGMPTGKLLPMTGALYDFTQPNGAPLGKLNLDDSFVHLKPGLLDNGPMVELRDPRSGYGLRITMISPAIKAIHVEAPPDSSYISLDPQFNYDDPFGREWQKSEDTGMVVLKPGQTAQWKIRLEIFALNSSASSHL